LGDVQEFVTNRPILSGLAFAGVYVGVTGFTLPGAAILTLLSGALFGSILGTILVNIGATAGATLSFLAARFVFGSSIQKKYATQLTKFNREVEENGAQYMLVLRLIPAFPFFLINPLAGLSKIPISTFIWTTSLGIIPGSFVYAFAGKQLASIDSVGGILSPGMIVAFGLLATLALLPVAWKKLSAKKDVHSDKKEEYKFSKM